MGKKALIASFAINGRHMGGKTQREMLDVALAKVNSVAGYGPDLICLPEVFLTAGGDDFCPGWQDHSRAMLDAMRERARSLHTYIITSAHEPSEAYPGYRYITAYLIDRGGEIAGKYRKQHTVYEESTQGHAIPSPDSPVFDTDFGRIGMLICFDIGWRDAWRRMAEQGARMVVWLSAYDGGNLLNTYAAHNMYYVVSSVCADHSRVIDLTGRTIAMGSEWDGLAMTRIDLSTTLFHIDRQYQAIDRVRAALGDKVTIHSHSQENVFTIEPNDPEWPIERICTEFGLQTYVDYHTEATRLQEEWKARFSDPA